MGIFARRQCPPQHNLKASNITRLIHLILTLGEKMQNHADHSDQAVLICLSGAYFWRLFADLRRCTILEALQFEETKFDRLTVI